MQEQFHPIILAWERNHARPFHLSSFIIFIGLLSIWVKTLMLRWLLWYKPIEPNFGAVWHWPIAVARGHLFCRWFAPGVRFQARSATSRSLIVNKQPGFLLWFPRSKTVAVPYLYPLALCVFLFRIRILVGDVPLKAPVENDNWWYHHRQFFVGKLVAPHLDAYGIPPILMMKGWNKFSHLSTLVIDWFESNFWLNPEILRFKHAGPCEKPSKNRYPIQLHRD